MTRFGMIVALLAAAPHAVAAQTGGVPYTQRGNAALEVAVNKSQTLRVDRPIARALIGSSDIADVVPVSVSSVYVMGKKIGVTNLTLIDNRGAIIAVVDVDVGPDAQGLKRRLADLMPGEHIGVSVSNDSIVLEGKVSGASAAQRAATIAETYAPKKVVNLMDVGAVQQVLLEVRFAEMTRGTVRALGISSISFFNGAIVKTNTTIANGVVTGNDLNSNNGLVGHGNVPAIDSRANPYSFLANILSAGISVQIDALEQQGLVHTLAEPNLVALSGETASFLAGGEFPVPTGVDNNGRIAIEFKQFGVALAFVPTVLDDGMINLSVAPEVSSLDPNNGVQISGFQIPGLKVRRAKTALELRDGQSFAMAGLIQSDFQDTVKAIPLLGRIPILGALFRSTLYNRNETELVIVVTPHIVRPVGPERISLPTDRVRQPSDTDLLLLGQTEKRGKVPRPDVRPGGIDGDYGHVLR